MRLVLALLALLAAPAASAAGPNVILITLTNVGARRTSLHGYERDTTPGLARWSRGALLFEDAYAPASWTLPSAVTLHTGLEPASHGVWNRSFRNALPRRVPTLARRFEEAGYRTALFAAGLDYHPRFSHLRPFRFRPENPAFSSFARTLAQAREWLDAYGAKPYFLVIQGYDAHCPFLASPPHRGLWAREEWRTVELPPETCIRGIESKKPGVYEGIYTKRCLGFPSRVPCDREKRPVSFAEGDARYLSARYDETIRQADALLAAFLEDLPPAAKDAVIVVTAEHGELFAKDGRFGRSGTLRGSHFDEVLHIPLLVRLPGVAPRRVKGFVGLADLAPSLLDWAGLPPLPDADGRPLRGLVEGGEAPRAFVATSLPYNADREGEGRALFPGQSLTESYRDREWKWTRERLVFDDGRPPQERVALYRVSEDPGETRDLAEREPETARRLEERFGAWRAGIRLRGDGGTTAIPEDLLRSARERGYWE